MRLIVISLGCCCGKIPKTMFLRRTKTEGLLRMFLARNQGSSSPSSSSSSSPSSSPSLSSPSSSSSSSAASPSSLSSSSSSSSPPQTLGSCGSSLCMPLCYGHLPKLCAMQSCWWSNSFSTSRGAGMFDCCGCPSLNS